MSLSQISMSTIINESDCFSLMLDNRSFVSTQRETSIFLFSVRVHNNVYIYNLDVF